MIGVKDDNWLLTSFILIYTSTTRVRRLLDFGGPRSEDKQSTRFLSGIACRTIYHIAVTSYYCVGCNGGGEIDK